MWPLYLSTDVKKQIDYDSNSKGCKIEIWAMCMRSFIHHGQFSLLYSTQIRLRDRQVRATPYLSHLYTQISLTPLHVALLLSSAQHLMLISSGFTISIYRFGSIRLSHSVCVFRFNLMIFPCALINKIESMWFRWVFFSSSSPYVWSCSLVASVSPAGFNKI